jgi:lipopolysaccharide/colanic/teichoic acid biosynthesis glycosyltransferase
VFICGFFLKKMTRFLDILLSSIALLIFFPFGVIIAIILKFTGEGEIFYTQERLGKGGKPVGLYKFATMLKNSPSIGTGDVTVKNDPRVLPFGKFLRKSKLNEVPQLFNILLGDISVVGPRPQTPKNFALFYELVSEETRQGLLSMRPGLTGVGSIVFRDEESLLDKLGMPVEQCYREVIGPHKAVLEMWYKEHQNIVTYCQAIFITAWVIVFPESEIYRKIWKTLPDGVEGV